MADKDFAEIPFPTQINAVLRKNAVYQRRRSCVNCCIIVLPIVFILMLYTMQALIDDLTDTRDNKCGCMCTLCCERGGPRDCHNATEDNQCDYSTHECKEYNDDLCDIRFSDAEQAQFCEIKTPFVWPPAVDIPRESERAREWRPNVTFLTYADDQEMEQMLRERLIRNITNITVAVDTRSGELAGEALGSTGAIFGGSIEPENTNHIDPIFVSSGLTVLSDDCTSEESEVALRVINNGLGELTQQTLVEVGRRQLRQGLATCANVSYITRTVEDINRYLFCSWEEARCNPVAEESGEELSAEELKRPDKYGQAFDFKDTSDRSLDADFWVRDWDLELDEDGGPPRLKRAPAVLNMIADAWMKIALGDNEYRSYLLGTQELPQQGSELNLEFSSLVAVLLTSWTVQLLLPLMLVQLVYEKEENLRIMMKMHGLGGGAYWLVHYFYYFSIYAAYIVVFIVCGTIADFVIFTKNSYGVLLLLLFLFGNAQISFAFAISNFFTSTRGCVIFSFLWIFGSGFIGIFLFDQLIPNDATYNYFIELIPVFAVYRGLYEFGEYGFRASYSDSVGLTWDRFDDTNNHMGYVLLVLLFEWPIFLILAWYLEQVIVTGSGVRQHPLFFLEYLRRSPPQHQPVAKSSSKELQLTQNNTTTTAPPQSSGMPPVASSGDPPPFVVYTDEAEDVAEERRRVLTLTPEEEAEHSIIIKNLRKVFPASEGVPEKVAVRDLCLAVHKGEVFGLLGPNGAGKTTTINMLIGFMNATSGHATIEGLDIDRDMKTLYTLMGVCPQHDLLWETLTGMEHLLFYGRLKGLKNSELREAAEAALKSVNLFDGNVKKLLVKKYSGGMKRRLSVAISFMGNPRVVYLDEPSTGLDPASRRNLWKVVKAAKQDKAIILTTHNMEEAEVLCDRLGIFVDGRLQVIGNPKTLTARYGGYLVFTLITVPNSVGRAAELILAQFPKAVETYHVGGTLKFDLPTNNVTPSSVFHFMEMLKTKIEVLDWGVATVTLEEVFIKIAKEAGAKTSELP